MRFSRRIQPTIDWIGGWLIGRDSLRNLLADKLCFEPAFVPCRLRYVGLLNKVKAGDNAGRNQICNLTFEASATNAMNISSAASLVFWRRIFDAPRKYWNRRLVRQKR